MEERERTYPLADDEEDLKWALLLNPDPDPNDSYTRCHGNYETYKLWEWLNGKLPHRARIAQIVQDTKSAGRGLLALENAIEDYVRDQAPDLGRTIFALIFERALKRIDFPRIAKRFYGPQGIIECGHCGLLKWGDNVEECPECKGQMKPPKHEVSAEMLVKSGVARDLIAAGRIIRRLFPKDEQPEVGEV